MTENWMRAYTFGQDVAAATADAIERSRVVYKREVTCVYLHPSVAPATWPLELPPLKTDSSLNRTLLYLEEAEAAPDGQMRLL